MTITNRHLERVIQQTFLQSVNLSSSEKRWAVFIHTPASTMMFKPGQPPPTAEPVRFYEQDGLLRKTVLGAQLPSDTLTASGAWTFTKLASQLTPHIAQLVDSQTGIASLIQRNSPYTVRTHFGDFRVIGVQLLTGGLVRFDLVLHQGRFN